jgi:hypothetical protein
MLRSFGIKAGRVISGSARGDCVRAQAGGYGGKRAHVVLGVGCAFGCRPCGFDMDGLGL